MMQYKIYFSTIELYGLTRYLIKRPPAKDWFGNINVLGVILTFVLYPMFIILDTFALPFLLLHSITIRTKDKYDLFLEGHTGKIENFKVIH